MREKNEERARASNNNRSQLGGRIKSLRNELNITQDRLAESIGETCRGKQVCSWECGKYEPSATRLFEIARALGVTPNDLAPEGMFVQSVESQGIVVMIESLEILDREAIFRIVESLHKKKML